MKPGLAFPSSLRHANNQSGVALILALICLFVMSTLAVGVMFSTQSEIWTTSSYRATTQARYLAEAGAQQAQDFLMSQSFSLPAQTIFAASVNANAFPVTYPLNGSNLVVLSTPKIYGASLANTYPTLDASMGTSLNATFQTYMSNAVAQAPFIAVSPNARFDVAIQLLAANQGNNGSYLMKWKIISQGTTDTMGKSTAGKARVQVVEVVDNIVTLSATGGGNGPTYTAGVFATGTGCGAISMSGGQYTNSYDSSTQPGNANPSYANSHGDVATMGNVSVTNGAYIIGSVFDPNYNKGTTGTYGISGGPWPGLNGSVACSTGTGGTEWAVNEDNSGSGVGCTSQSASSCSQKTYPMPSPLPTYPTPVMPTVAVNTAAMTSSSSGAYYGLAGGGSGGGHGCSVTIPPSTNPDGTANSGGMANFGAVNFGSCAVITLQAGTYDMDSLLISNGAKVILPTTGSVVINILDNGTTTNPLNVNGGTMANNGGNPANLTFVYAGTKQININAGANMFGTIYAPNASAVVNGNAGLYGAMIVKTAAFQGSAHVIYDTHLANQSINVNVPGTPTSVIGSLHVDEFSWSAF